MTKNTPKKRACPKCGGTTGFRNTYQQRYTAFVDFYGDVEDTSEPAVTWESKRFYCQDCQANISRYVKSLGILL